MGKNSSNIKIKRIHKHCLTAPAHLIQLSKEIKNVTYLYMELLKEESYAVLLKEENVTE